jgi:hypothetical protein
MSLTESPIFDKDPWRRFFLTILIILVATLSFGIGRLTSLEKGEGIKIEYDPELAEFAPKRGEDTTQTASVIKSLKPTGEGIVASKNGSKYHYLHCSGAKQIKEENKITFNSAKDAEASGYTLATNCQPR